MRRNHRTQINPDKPAHSGQDHPTDPVYGQALEYARKIAAERRNRDGGK